MSTVQPTNPNLATTELPQAPTGGSMDPILLDPRVARIHRVNPTLPLSALKRIAEFNPDRDAVDEQGYPIYLDESDGIPLETYWHAQAPHLLIEGIHSHRAGRMDYFCANDMFVYYSAEQARNKDYRGPDFFLVNDVNFLPIRKYWAVWLENFRYPDLVVEFISPTTKSEDLEVKFDIYQDVFETREYVAYDPETAEFFAWRKVDGKFQTIAPDSDGRIFLETAGLSIGTWYGAYNKANTRWVRFYHRHGDVVLVQWEQAELKATEAEMKANEAEFKANEAMTRAETERQRAESLAAEVARLKAQLEKPT